MADVDFVFPKGGKQVKADTPEKEPSAAPVPGDVDFVYPKQNRKYNKREKKAIDDALLPPVPSALLRGATMGLSDKAIALMRPGDYKSNLEKEFEARDVFNQDPIRHYGSEFAGGALTMSPLFSAGRTAVKMAAPKIAEYAAQSGIGPYLTRLGGDLLTGAGLGATMGAGQAPHGQELEGAVTGAKYGAAVPLAMKGMGATASAAVGAGKDVYQRIMQFAGVTDPEKWAAQRLIKSMLEDGHTPDSIALKLREMAGSGPMSKPVVVADALGPNAKDFVKSAINKKGPGRQLAADKIGTRTLETPDRLSNDISNTLSPNYGYTTEAKRIAEAGAAQSKPLYDAAMAFDSPNAEKALEFFKKNKFRQSFFDEVAGRHEMLGQPLKTKIIVKPDGELEFAAPPTIEDLHRIKLQLDEKRNSLWDDQANKFKGEVTIGGHKFNANELGNERKELIALIEDLTPNGKVDADGKAGSLYRDARKIYSDHADTQDALKKGFQILKTRPEDVKLEFEALGSKTEKDAYLAGVAASLNDKTNGDMLNRASLWALSKPSTREKLESIFPDEQKKQLFNQAMDTEQAMLSTNQYLAPKTQNRDFLGNAGADFALPISLANFFMGRPGSGLANLSRYGSNQIENMSPAFAEPAVKLGLMGPEEMSTFAADHAARQNGLFGKIRGALSSAGGAVGEAAPYVGAGMAGEQGALSLPPADTEY